MEILAMCVGVQEIVDPPSDVDKQLSCGGFALLSMSMACQQTIQIDKREGIRGEHHDARVQVQCIRHNAYRIVVVACMYVVDKAI